MSKPEWRDDALLFRYEWTFGNGHSLFGYFGTLRMWIGKLEEMRQQGDEVNIKNIQYVCTGKEQNEFSEEMSRQTKALFASWKKPTP